MTKTYITLFLTMLAVMGSWQARGQNLALNKAVTASTSEAGMLPGNALDGNGGTRWASDYVSPSWIKIDLTQTTSVTSVVLNWERASAESYHIMVSDVNSTPDPNSADWTIISTQTGMADAARVDNLGGLSGSGRYIAMYGYNKLHPWGYSLWEFEVYGQTGPANQAPVANAGADQTLSGQTSATLNGSASYDPDNGPSALSYQWTQTAGPAASFSNNTVASPQVSGLQAGNTYTFSLIVNDGAANSGADAVNITVNAGSGGCNTSANLALNQPAGSSSVEGPFIASSAFDGDPGTRWASGFNADEWLRVDLGSSQNVCQVDLNWEAAYASSYEIRIGNSTDINTSTVIATVTNSDGGIDNVNTNSSMAGRYVFMKGLTRALPAYGYSIWEMTVYGGQSTGGGGDTQAPTAPGNLVAQPAVYAVNLAWAASTDNVGVTGYRVYQSGISSPVATLDGSITSFTASNLSPNTQYTYLVRAIDAAGNLSPEASVTFTTQDNSTGGGGIIAVGNIALSTDAYTSTVAGDGANIGGYAVDGNITSRWESASTDSEWIYLDLGQRYELGRAILHWETASGKHYQIQVSDDAQNWTTVYDFNEENLPVEPRTDDLLFEGTGQYIRMNGLERNTQWSYSLFEFEVYSPGSGPGDLPAVNPNPNPDPVPPGPAAFNVLAPTNGAMVTNTRFPTLNWNGVAGATTYEVWVNISRTDYDWGKWGSLLDRFTKVGETTGTSFTLTQPLSDRWTYKWYIVARTGSGNVYSDLGQFSLYLPVVETMDDGVAIINGCRDLNKNGTIEPYEDWRQPLNVRINDLMSRMTNEEKAYQMFYNAQLFPISGWHFGPAGPSDLYNFQKTTAQTRLGIPFVSLGDCIHGYKTSYPTQIGMAASRNLNLTHECGRVQREEQVAVGFRGTLAPLAEVGTKALYPRIQEGGGEDAEFAAAQVRALVAGLQGGPELNPNSVLVTTKHWPGEGAGGEGGIVFDGISIKYHMKPWFANMDAGAGSIMPGYAGSSFLDPGGPGAGDSKPILDYLRDTVKFDGIICTDWLPWGNWVAAAKAGSDVMGGADPGAVGFSMNTFINEVGMTRINEAVYRILDVKFRLGIFEDPYGDPVNGPNEFHTQEHLDVVTQAARESITMIKNDGTAPLNLPAGANLLVTGSRADDGESHTIWTTAFHWEYGTRNILQAIQDKAATRGINVYHDNAPNPTAAVVVVGEGSYTHATAWEKTKPYVHDTYFKNELEADSTRLNQVRAMGIPYIVVVISPRPYVLTQIVNDANAVFLAYRPGDGGGPAVADVLFGDFAPKGKLPWQLPRSMSQIGGDQLSTANERWDIPYDLGATSSERQEIRAKIAAGDPIAPIYGDPLFQYGFGLTYGGALATMAEDEAAFEEMSTRNDGVEMYPNPVSHRLNVRTESTGPVVYRIVNPSGKIIQSGESKFANFTLDTHTLQSGIYILVMEMPEGKPVTKLFVKE